MRVLTWNLMHGRAEPPAGRDLLDEFAAALARWEWDVALLQEVPPWWPASLAARLGADFRRVLTSRNALLPIRRSIAIRWPDLIKSNGGGSNAILSRRAAVVAHRTRRLCWLPERRWVHAVRLTDGMWLGNLHTAADPTQGETASEVLRTWAGTQPVVLGGDFNVRQPTFDGYVHAGGFDADHLFVRGLQPHGEAHILERGRLSDHAPVVVTVDQHERDRLSMQQREK
jgi:endonuclease/exonuclease/phosphatase family metal-dependent hydrolase